METASWLLRLDADPAFRIAPASSAGLVERAVSLVGRGPVEWAVQRAHAMAVRIVAEMPQFGGTPDAFDVLRMGTEATTVQSLVFLSTGITERPASAEALEGVVDFVRRGIGLDAVLRGVRLGHAEMIRGFIEGCERLVPSEARLSEVKRVSEELFEYIDAFSALMAEHYVAEQVRWSTSAVAARRDLVIAVLKDLPSDAADVSRRLAYPLRGSHLAFVLWTESAGAEVDPAELQRATLDLVRHLPVVAHLVLPVSSGTVWAWVTGHTPIDGQLSEAAQALAPHLHLAAGRAGAGVEGFRRSHQQAEAAARLDASVAHSRRIVLYEDVELLSLLLADRDRAIEFASRVLGPLWRSDAHTEDLRTTLRVFLEERGSAQSTSRRLHLARNTVSYRVQRAEEMMGSPVEGHLSDVQTALLIAEAVRR